MEGGRNLLHKNLKNLDTNHILYISELDRRHTIISSPLSNSHIEMCPRSVPTATSPVPILVLDKHTTLSPSSEQ